MNGEALRKFLVDFNKAGYAAGKEKKWVKEVTSTLIIGRVNRAVFPEKKESSGEKN